MDLLDIDLEPSNARCLVGSLTTLRIFPSNFLLGEIESAPSEIVVGEVVSFLSSSFHLFPSSSNIDCNALVS